MLHLARKSRSLRMFEVHLESTNSPEQKLVQVKVVTESSWFREETTEDKTDLLARL